MEDKSKNINPVNTQASVEPGATDSVVMDEKPHVLPAGHDDALEMFDGHPENFVFSSKESRRVLWKLDLILLPMMITTWILNYMDKVALSEASIFGIQKDLNLVGRQYNWSSSIFYLGYFVWQYPSSILMQKLPIGRYFGAMILLWGLATTTTAFTKNFATLCVNRVFLGFFETCMSPILTILVGQYWTRDEQPFRAMFWWSGSAVGAFIADAISYGVSGQSFTRSQYSIWQIIYLVFGPITMLWGLVVFFGVPTSPMNAWFLNARERKVAVARVVENHTGIENREYKVHQVMECLKDPQPWLLALNAFLQTLQGGGFTSFSKIVLTGMGYSSRESTLMSMPSNAIHLVSNVFAGWFCGRVMNSRCLMMVATNVVCLVGAVLIDNLPSHRTSSRLGAFYSMYVSTVSFGIGMSMVSSNIGGFTKKATAGVMMFLGYCIGQFCGPQFFKPEEAPRYPTAFRAFYSAVSLQIIFELGLMVWLIVQNRRRDKLEAEAGGHTQEGSELMDLTDWEQPSFRYRW